MTFSPPLDLLSTEPRQRMGQLSRTQRPFRAKRRADVCTQQLLFSWLSGLEARAQRCGLGNLDQWLHFSGPAGRGRHEKLVRLDGGDLPSRPRAVPGREAPAFLSFLEEGFLRNTRPTLTPRGPRIGRAGPVWGSVSSGPTLESAGFGQAWLPPFPRCRDHSPVGRPGLNQGVEQEELSRGKRRKTHHLGCVSKESKLY